MEADRAWSYNEKLVSSLCLTEAQIIRKIYGSSITVGLDRKFLESLRDFVRAGLISPGHRVAEIGAQQLANNFLEAGDLLDEIYSLFGRPRPQLGQPNGNGAGMASSAPSSQIFWSSLGLSCTAIDFDGHKDSQPIDLNREAAPVHLYGCFDLVVNCGTTEHVVNQNNAFAVIHDLAKVGGIMYHDVPVCMFGHGLVNYSPRFFLQLFRQNDYEPLFIRVYAWEETKIPSYVRAINRKWGNGHIITFEGVRDITISAAFRKDREQSFFTPLDLPRSLMVIQYLKRFRQWKNIFSLR